MKELVKEVQACTICQEFLPLGPRPVFSLSEESKILVVGQAPGTKVHTSGIPWNDASGRTLRKWLNVSDEQFYDNQLFGILPMGFCYPGKGKSGDLPPRKECAPTWHEKLLTHMPNIKLVLLIGLYAQRHYLQKEAKRTLTETVKNWESYQPKFFPMPHPSPRNRYWLQNNEWFETDLLPILQQKVGELI